MRTVWDADVILSHPCRPRPIVSPPPVVHLIKSNPCLCLHLSAVLHQSLQRTHFTFSSSPSHMSTCRISVNRRRCSTDILCLLPHKHCVRVSVPCPPGVRGPPDMERVAANVHYTLLIACVLVAFFLGAILSGFLVSCYCSRSAAHRARRLGKDPEASLPHALSLRSLAKLNGLLDVPSKVPDDV